jgi:hypothetical protein
MQKATQNNDNRMVWPFPTDNGVRTPESQKLLDQKRHYTTKPDLSDVEDAPL